LDRNVVVDEGNRDANYAAHDCELKEYNMDVDDDEGHEVGLGRFGGEDGRGKGERDVVTEK